MARGRMISRTLGESDRFAELDSHAQRMLYMMLVTHADSEGRLKGNTRWIAGKVLTYLDYPEDEIEAALHRMHAVGLIQLYQVEGKRFIQIERFHDHNTVRRGKDGQPTHESPSSIPDPTQGSDVPTSEQLRSSDVAATGFHQSSDGYTSAEVEVEVEVEDKDMSSFDDESSENALSTSTARRTQPNIDDEILRIWNENCGQLANARVVSREAAKHVRALRKRHGDEAFLEMFEAGISAVRDDEWWLGSKAKDVKRQGRPYGLVNYLRHVEDLHDRAEDGASLSAQRQDFSDVTLGETWYSELGVVSILEIGKNGTGRTRAKVKVLRPIGGGHEAGDVVDVDRLQLRRKRA